MPSQARPPERAARRLPLGRGEYLEDIAGARQCKLRYDRQLGEEARGAFRAGFKQGDVARLEYLGDPLREGARDGAGVGLGADDVDGIPQQQHVAVVLLRIGRKDAGKPVGTADVLGITVRRHEDGVAATAELRLMQGRVGTAQQHRGVAALLPRTRWIDGPTDAERQRHGMLQIAGRGNRPAQLLGHAADRRGSRARQQNPEHGPAIAEQQIGAAQRAAQPIGDLGEDAVSVLAPQTLVHGQVVIGTEQQQPQRSLGLLGVVGQAIELRLQLDTARQASHPVLQQRGRAVQRPGQACAGAQRRCDPLRQLGDQRVRRQVISRRRAGPSPGRKPRPIQTVP